MNNALSRKVRSVTRNAKKENDVIRAWMRAHRSEHIDECGELNCTSLVEAWDRDNDAGDATVDPDHIAWEIAVELA